MSLKPQAEAPAQVRWGLLGEHAGRERLVMALYSEKPPDWDFTLVAIKRQAILIKII